MVQEGHLASVEISKQANRFLVSRVLRNRTFQPQIRHLSVAAIETATTVLLLLGYLLSLGS
jgi:hypothetical protein